MKPSKTCFLPRDLSICSASFPFFTRKTKNKPQVQAWKFCASPILRPVPRNLWPFPACLAAYREALTPLFPTWPQGTGLQVQLELQLHTGKHAQKDLDQMGPLPGPTYEQGLLHTQSLAWLYDREGLHPTTAQKCSASCTSCTRLNISPSFINASNVCMWGEKYMNICRVWLDRKPWILFPRFTVLPLSHVSSCHPRAVTSQCNFLSTCWYLACADLLALQPPAGAVVAVCQGYLPPSSPCKMLPMTPYICILSY